MSHTNTAPSINTSISEPTVRPSMVEECSCRYCIAARMESGACAARCGLPPRIHPEPVAKTERDLHHLSTRGLSLIGVDLDVVVVVVVVVDLDGDGDVEVDATFDAQIIFVSIATTPSSS